MKENIYLLSDKAIIKRMGNIVQKKRLAQNITQQQLAEMSATSLSTVQKIERGDIGSLLPFLQILRTLRMLEKIEGLIEEDEISPNEYLYFVEEQAAKYSRKHATGNRIKK